MYNNDQGTRNNSVKKNNKWTPTETHQLVIN